MRKAEVAPGGREFQSDQVQCDVHQADFGDGEITVVPGLGLTVARVENGTCSAVSLVTMVPGFGVAVAVTPDEARTIADSLNRIASEIDQIAMGQATAAIEMARGK